MGGLNKLRAMSGFVRIVENGSLTSAAADLGISLPSVVRMLAALESELGTTLLNCTTRRIHLTDDGRRYLEHCRQILGHVQEAEATLRANRALPHGRIALTTSVAFGQMYIGSIVNEFVQRYPDVTVDYLLINRIVNLVEEGFDAAIRIGHLHDFIVDRHSSYKSASRRLCEVLLISDGMVCRTIQKMFRAIDVFALPAWPRTPNGLSA